MIDFDLIRDTVNNLTKELCKKIGAIHNTVYAPFRVTNVEWSIFDDEAIVTYCALTTKKRIIIGIHPGFERFSKSDQDWLITHEACHAFCMKRLDVLDENCSHGREWQMCMRALGQRLQY